MRCEQQIHSGSLFLDQNKRYCIWEPDRQAPQMITLTSGCALEIWLGQEWVSGCVEGDGQDYWFYGKAEGKYLLSERMVVRYQEPI